MANRLLKWIAIILHPPSLPRESYGRIKFIPHNLRISSKKEGQAGTASAVYHRWKWVRPARAIDRFQAWAINGEQGFPWFLG
jgi:hypothetical protein